ncbi:hypothetical protein ABI_07150 [Asticcacaulis biprosthecium C19]|uniref:Uncharacterized protein n=1 Tax=Asticcacaulis biprosthecium C19 TaxID=715226 RepID=F4QLD6_9CAUL|nr:hypothetical protein [Asticcacaulis biprosthecium]EGF92281.1 hypothetical protein ABI_07150 [Asticcacaulis biprosthecium C19]
MVLAADIPAVVCSNDKPINLTLWKTVETISPDCRWKLIAMSADTITESQSEGNVSVIDTRSGRTVTTFMMDRSASVHWLKDGRTLIVNHFAGSGWTEPLVIALAPESLSATPENLADLLFPDVLKRLNRRREQVYHYYANYIGDVASRILVSVQADYVLSGDTGPANARCFIYSVDKAELSGYRFEREVPWQDGDLTCPHHPDEKWD